MTGPLALLPVIIGAGLVAGCLVLLLTGLGRKGPALRKRAIALMRPATGPALPEKDPAARGSRGRRSAANRPRGLAGRLATALPDPAFLRIKIARTGIQVSPWTLIAGGAAVAALLALALVFGAGQPPLIAAPAGLAIGFGIPYVVLGMLVKRRLNRFLNMMPEAIDVIVRGVRSGLPVTEAIATVAREMDDPIGTEFRRTIDSYRLGRPLAHALADTARRLNLAELNFLVVALSIQQETGGNLSETLSNLADIIRKRRQMRLKVQALTGEAKASAAVVGSLPFLLFLVIHFVNPGYTDIFFNEPRGHTMLIAGLVSMGFGLGVMYKLANFEI